MANVLVAYFSATGRTKAAATRLAAVSGADIYEIVPAEPYTEDDLNWRDFNSRSSVEMKKNPDFRPAIGSEKVADMDKYDTIFLLYPIWWYRCPTIVNSFVESYDMSGKTIVLYATSGSSGLGSSVEVLKGSAPGADIVEGSMLNKINSDDELKGLVEKYLC
ncbi:MAG: NAD(P)H-dependent oxidoreductase [Eubacterium sp.]|nr:NAD(P)H-dependent oxidoreductase [Eubacterium sp.]